MAVKIKVLGQEVSEGAGVDEYNAALALRDCFEEEFSKPREEVSGTILIKPNFKANGFTPEDIDLVCWINLENFKYDVYTGFQFKDEDTGTTKVNHDRTRKTVNIKSMLLALELKSHTHEGISFSNNDLKVTYNGRQSSAIEQSNGQKYSLVNFIKKNDRHLKDVNPRVNNLVWLNQMTGNKPWGCQLTNVLVGKLTFKKLMEGAFEHVPPFRPTNSSGYFQSAFDDRSLTQNANVLLENIFLNYDKKIELQQGDISRKKIERVVQKQLEGKYKTIFNGIGQKTTILKGVPGSGKTINLMHFAYHLAAKKGKRCLILTYNRALMADIQYLSVLSGFKDDPSSATVGTNTCVKLMRALMIAFGIYEGEPATLNLNEKKQYFQLNFQDKYETLLNSLLDTLQEFLKDANNNDIEEIKKELPALNWEVILIDESQDWFSQERDILFLLFGRENFVISYGAFQLLRSRLPLNWLEGAGDSQELTLKTSYRQKANLCSFIKPITHEFEIENNIEANSELLGGKVRVFTRPFTIEDYRRVEDYCIRTCKNAGYDILVLINNHDDILSQFREKEIEFHDGTQITNRGKVPSSMEASRVFNYRSCRGLEGWVVIANNLDTYLESLINAVTEADEFMTLAQTKDKLVGRWLYMILSRPIDTLIITLKDTKKPISQLILRTANQKQDYCKVIRS